MHNIMVVCCDRIYIIHRSLYNSCYYPSQITKEYPRDRAGYPAYPMLYPDEPGPPPVGSTFLLMPPPPPPIVPLVERNYHVVSSSETEMKVNLKCKVRHTPPSADTMIPYKRPKGG